jgi:glycerophosphoryl diester phosphodiesterase
MQLPATIRTAVAFLALGAMLGGCAASRHSVDMPKNVSFYNVGHRGTRGLMPENTIPAFEKGIEVGANTIEFDVHITKDNKVVVYHDDSFTPSYTTMPDGSDIPQADRKKYTFFQMNYPDIRKFIIGKKYYPAFPHQHLQATYAPLLSEMIDSVESFTAREQYRPVIYLLEVKSSAQSDGFAQPDPEMFMKTMMAVLKPYLKSLRGRLIIQSFDARPLKIIHRDYPRIPIGFLTGDGHLDTHITQLGFTPAYYNPQFGAITPELLKACHEKGVKVLPWTVEDVKDMRRLKAMGVDGIITDYPDRVRDLK